MARLQQSIRKEWGLRFTGTGSQKITFATQASLGNIKLQAFTWSCWFKAVTPASTVELVRWRTQGTGIEMTSAGEISVFVTDVGVASTTATTKNRFADNHWHHAAFTWDGTDAKIYIDGTLENTGTGARTVSYPNDDSFVIAADGGVATYFTGSMKDFRILNSTLTATQVADLYALPPFTAYGTPVMWIKMDEGTGTNCADSSSSGYTGTISGRTTTGATPLTMWVIDPVKPRRRAVTSQVSSIGFNGTTSKVVIPTASDLDITTGDFSFEYKVFVNKTLTQITFAKRSAGTFIGYESFFDNTTGTTTRNTFCADFDDSQYAIAASNVPVTCGRWYHIICSVNRASQENFRLFVNGIYDVTYINEVDYAATVSSISNGVSLEFMDRNGANFTQGGMYDVRLYNRALTDDECLSRYYMAENITSGRVGWWKMDETTGSSIADSQGTNTGTLTAGTFTNNTMS